MNILLVNYEYPPLGGGAANATLFLSRAFVQLGHSVVVLTSGFGDLPATEESGAVRVIRLPLNRRRADRSNLIEMGKFAWSARQQCLQIARIHSIGLTIAFFTLPCGPVAHLLHRKMSLPYIISLRGGDVPGLVPGLRPLHGILTPWRRRVLRDAHAIVANDTGLATLSTAADPFPVQVVPNGVDADFFCPNLEPSDDRLPFRWLFCGRLHPQKNLPLLLEEFADARRTLRTDGTLDLVGDGPSRAALVEQAERLGIASHLRWHGWLAKDRIRECYQKADGFLNPSLYEGMPNTVLEAMASGLPVIASDIPGNRSLVESAKNGLLVPPRASGEISRAMQRFELDRPWARELGAAGRAQVITRHSWPKVAESYLELARAGPVN